MTSHGKKTWSLPYKYVISNKAKEVHFKILHGIYPANHFVARFLNLADLYTFCNQSKKTIPHLLFHCNVAQSKQTWLNNSSYTFTLKDIICYFVDPNSILQYVVFFFILSVSTYSTGISFGNWEYFGFHATHEQLQKCLTDDSLLCSYW